VLDEELPDALGDQHGTKLVAIGLVLVLSVDWFMGIARALGNLIGNCVATVAIAAWEGDIDRDRARSARRHGRRRYRSGAARLAARTR
jgi:Na+/H+-dicarboxylate symporter